MKAFVKYYLVEASKLLALRTETHPMNLYQTQTVDSFCANSFQLMSTLKEIFLGAFLKF